MYAHLPGSKRRSARRLVEANGARYYHFLRPSEYVPAPADGGRARRRHRRAPSVPARGGPAIPLRRAGAALVADRALHRLATAFAAHPAICFDSVPRQQQGNTILGLMFGPSARRRRRRRADGEAVRDGSRLRGRYHLLLVAGALVASLVAMEAVLRLWPTLLGVSFANGVRSRYTTRAGGIYYRDPPLRMNFMIPGLRTSMYYNGYTWTHEADALGFRNQRVVIPADVVLLGDSFIYGHGVELESTVGSYLAQILGRPVANLARQGDSAYQEAYLLSTHIGLYRPRHVVYFYFENDVSDLPASLTDEAMRAFVAAPLASIGYPPRMEVSQALRERERRLASRAWYWPLTRRSYVVRAWRWLEWSRERAPAPPARAPAVAGSGAPTVTTSAAPAPIAAAAPTAPDDDAGSLGWQYTRKAIAYMQYVAERHGARLLVVPITPTNPRHFQILRAIAAELSLPFLDTSALPRDPSLWLPHDGHFSPAGARRMAEMVADQLGKGGVVP
jgi:hypothetical protein